MPDRGNELIGIDRDYIKANSVRMPECVFPLGTRLEHVAPELLEIDRKKHLSIGSILDSTPLCWVHLPEFMIGKRMVTNAEYKAFLHYVDDESSNIRLFDRPDLWNYAWSELNFRVRSVKMPMRGTDGATYESEEDYSDCSGFVEAYINSLKFEANRILTSSEAADSGAGMEQQVVIKRRGQKTQRIELPGHELLPRLFAFVRYVLRDAIVGPGEDDCTFLSDEELSAVEKYRSLEQVENDITMFIAKLKTGYMQAIDRRFVQAFDKGQFRVAPILFLERVKFALSKAKDITRPIPLSSVLYPRFWDSPKGKKGRDFLKRRANWNDLPVEGITIYEALAFTVWLSGIGDMTIQLPNEAEYERAASWPTEESPQEKAEVILDPSVKDLLPWQSHNDKDFNYYFGNEGKEVDEYYVADRQKYDDLLNETARRVGDELLCHLTGFGWQWTSDRYDERERKYNRFESTEYPVFEGTVSKLKDGEQLQVYEYEPNRNVQSSYFVMRGAPDVLGGPGLLTRRYSAYPLRGHRKVGFRWVIKTEE